MYKSTTVAMNLFRPWWVGSSISVWYIKYEEREVRSASAEAWHALRNGPRQNDNVITEG